MFVKVKLLKGFFKNLWYQIPQEWGTENFVGKILQVPIQNRTVAAVVIEQHNTLPDNVNFKIRKAKSIEAFPCDSNYAKLTHDLANIFFLEPLYFYQRIKNFLKEKKNNQDTPIDLHTNQDNSTANQITLTEEQQAVTAYLKPLIHSPKYSPTLMHGVTGSGKTEVYADLINENIKNNKIVIFLLPEVSLSIQFQNIFKNKLPEGTPIFGFHSASKEKEKKDLWSHLVQGKPALIIGVHLPILLPISNLGLIIIDEEHDPNFQEKKHPSLNSKNIAIYRAQTYNIPILLGSATPSLSSINNVKNKGWKLFKLTKRFAGEFPKIKQVLIETKSKRKNFWITRELEHEINQCLTKKEQVLIFLNRRGYSFFVMCKECSFVFECPNCSVSLTLHIDKSNHNSRLKCHYCTYQRDLPKNCPSCKTSDDNFIKKGIGTQQLVTILEKIFPQATISRADLDTTKKKREWSSTIKEFEEGNIDILVGTQTITKGYHFPNVTLVGILWADIGLHFPMFNAAEICLQQLIQAAGRAGRQRKGSKVIVQTMNDHNIFNYLNEQNYLKFYENESEFRRLTSYPPFSYLVQIEARNINSQDLDKEIELIFSELEKKQLKGNLKLQLLGPTKPAVYKIQKTESRQIFIKSKSYKDIHTLLHTFKFEAFKSKIFITMLS